MNTSTRITASLMDAISSNPLGFTLNIETGEVVDHGIAVGGYHREDGDSNRNWLQLSTGGVRNNFAYPVSLPFDEIQRAVEASLNRISFHKHIGGWLVGDTLTLDIVEVYPCILHQEGIADATAFIEGSRLDQEAIGWLCPDFEHGYKEVGVNF